MIMVSIIWNNSLVSETTIVAKDERIQTDRTRTLKHTIGISDMKISNQSDDILITYSLGSCVGVTIFDAVAGVGGMIHCMLPLSKIDPQKAQKNPFMFVDTGIPEMFEAAYKLGATKNRIVVKVAGGSRILDEKGMFRIGERNYAVLRKILWKNNILINAEDVGGSVSRTMTLEMTTGQVVIKSRNMKSEL